MIVAYLMNSAIIDSIIEFFCDWQIQFSVGFDLLMHFYSWKIEAAMHDISYEKTCSLWGIVQNIPQDCIEHEMGGFG
jgi:hypothetical protein